MPLVHRKVLLLLICTASISVFSQPVFNYHKKCKEVYNDVLKLKIPYAQKIIGEEKIKEPNNCAWLLLQSYSDMLTIFTNEDYEAFEQLEQDFDDRLKILNQLENTNPWKRFAKAEMHIHKAVARAKFEEFFATVWEIRKGHKLLKENKRLFPNFKPNQKSLSVFNAVFGTIPDKYKFGAKLLGFKGNVEEGMQQMEAYLTYAKAEDMFYDEILLLHNFFLIYLDKDFERAYQIAITKFQPNESLLHNFMTTEMAYKSGRIEEAIEIAENYPKGPDYMPYPFMDYYLGVCKMTQLNTAEAKTSIKLFLENFKGRHYIKQAWQRLALCYLIEEDTTKYFTYLENAKEQGYRLYDSDRQAYADAVNETLPNTNLLKARLLSDGGYYERALEILLEMEDTSIAYHHNSERLYRTGKVYESLKDTVQAISNYKQTIDLALNDEYYFAAKASLQLANLYKQKEEFELAKTYFKKVLSYTKHPYKDSFEQQAKAGISNL